MRLLLDILEVAGLGTAAGIRPFFPALLAGALARANLGIDFGGGPWAFLESPGWLLAIMLALIVVVLLERSGPSEALDDGPLAAAVGGIGIGIGALLGAGTLAGDHHVAWPGLLIGGACALLAQVAVRALFARVRARLDADAARALPVYADFSSLVSAGLAVLAPPVAVIEIGFLGWLYVGGRRRDAEKHEGLRSLR